ncbi:hypothetical protein EVAR_82965_1 [Eumeta japonica]|uniref:Uncharacterized protein n=1 Tax=Eumeta variegata TaxID=151549 RepID=A0A4C1VT71_EUMVA|nr:hypothetical protein EVAR_82965_1 [Eumeta japonica]
MHSEPTQMENRCWTCNGNNLTESTQELDVRAWALLIGSASFHVKIEQQSFAAPATRALFYGIHPPRDRMATTRRAYEPPPAG